MGAVCISQQKNTNKHKINDIYPWLSLPTHIGCDVTNSDPIVPAEGMTCFNVWGAQLRDAESLTNFSLNTCSAAVSSNCWISIDFYGFDVYKLM